MRIKALHPNFIFPVQSNDSVAVYDLYMPEKGMVSAQQPRTFGLGFAADIPEEYIGLVLPNPQFGTKFGVELVCTAGVFLPGFHDEWKVTLKTKSGTFSWEEETKLLQLVLFPAPAIRLEEVEEF